MTIRVVCPSCQKGINAPEKYAGRTAKCPGCQGPIVIPALEVELEEVPVEEAKEVQETPTQVADEAIENSPLKKGKLGKSKKVGAKKIGGSSPSVKKTKSVSGPPAKKPKAASREGLPKQEGENQKKKLALWGGVAVATVLIAGGAWWALGASSASGPDDRDLLTLMPKSEGFGGMNLNKLLAIPTLRKELGEVDEVKMEKVLSELSDSPEGQRMAEELKESGFLGLIEGNISDVAFSVNTNKADEKTPHSLMLIKTLKNAPETLAWMTKAFKTPLTSMDLGGGVAAFKTVGEPGLVSAIGENTVAFASDEGTLRQALAIQKGEVEGQSEASDSGQLVWFNWASQGKALFPNKPGMPFQAEDLLSGTIGADYDDLQGLKLSLGTQWKTAEKATELHGVLSQQLGFLMGMMLKLGKDDWSLEVAGDRLSLGIQFTPEKLDSFKKSEGDPSPETP